MIPQKTIVVIITIVCSSSLLNSLSWQIFWKIHRAYFTKVPTPAANNFHRERICFGIVYRPPSMFKTLTMKAFISNVGVSFLKVIPAYPFLAVIISFVFLFVITFFESLHLPTQWLNWPIYYGTLYGPFVWVYMSVKRRVCREISSTRSELPYFTNNRKQLSVIFEEGSDICWQTRGWWKG